jgi:hypothetical protein
VAFASRIDPLTMKNLSPGLRATLQFLSTIHEPA